MGTKRENFTASNFNPGPGTYNQKDIFSKIESEKSNNKYEGDDSGGVFFIMENGNLQKKM